LRPEKKKTFWGGKWGVFEFFFQIRPPLGNLRKKEKKIETPTLSQKIFFLKKG